jgi:hypothetical protein
MQCIMSRETRNVRLVMIRFHQEYNCSAHCWYDSNATANCHPQVTRANEKVHRTLELIHSAPKTSNHRVRQIPAFNAAKQRPSRTKNIACTKWMETSRKRDGTSHIFRRPTWLLCSTKLPLFVDSSHHTVNPQRPIASDGRAPKITTIPIFQTTTHSRLKDVTDKCQNSAQGPAVETQRTMHVWDIHRLSETYAASSLLKQLVIEYVYRRRVRVRPLWLVWDPKTWSLNNSQSIQTVWHTPKSPNATVINWMTWRSDRADLGTWGRHGTRQPFRWGHINQVHVTRPILRNGPTKQERITTRKNEWEWCWYQTVLRPAESCLHWSKQKDKRKGLNSPFIPFHHTPLEACGNVTASAQQAKEGKVKIILHRR